MIERVRGSLYRSSRPCYGEWITAEGVADWLEEAREAEVASIVCLLRDELERYEPVLGMPLLEYYRQAGFEVCSIPVTDYRVPPLTEGQLEAVWEAYTSLPKPVLVHCSAGIDRTGASVRHILEREGP